MSFELDFSNDVADINLGKSGKMLAPKNDTIALIDADTIIFASCSSCEYEEMSTDKNGDVVVTMNIDLDQAYNHAIDKIQTILDNTGCKDWELHFTIGRESFRYTRVDSNYKANRLVDNEGKKVPCGLYELKKLFKERHSDKAFLWTDCEADDAVVFLKVKHYDKYTLCALDKDVLYSIPGTHFNYYSSILHNKEMKFYDVDETTALLHHYKQVLTGDAGDGIIGLKGVGPKTAEKILNSAIAASVPLWDAIVMEYEARGRCEIDAIMNMRLVNMHQVTALLDDGKAEIQLWRPEK